ncbi:MAG TPA: hypothetical protein VJP77_01910 [Planctomycetota bacterium]|nr:hypothetical protein [Planctomycetota bacterium]
MSGRDAPPVALATRPPWEENPYRPFSLRDLLDWLSGSDFVEMVQRVSDLQHQVPSEYTEEGGEEAAHKDAMICLDMIREQALELSLSGTARRASRLFNDIRLLGPHLYFEDFPKQADELRVIFESELETQRFLCLHPTYGEHFENRRPFGEAVFESFPSVAYDIEEAAKCLALGRSTATVMHLARVGELATRLLARRLDVAEEWSALKGAERILKEIESRIDGMKGKAKTMEDAAELEFLADASGRLKDAKDAWRNPAMHARAEKYTEQEAKDIYDSMARLMRSLAGRLSEVDADPQAEGA